MNRTAYFFWSGPMPYLNRLTLDSFHKYNPDWKMVLWVGEQEFDIPDYVESRDVKVLGLPKTLRIQQTADLSKWWSLANEGGVVCDMDILFLKPLPKEVEVEVGLIYYSPKNPTVGFMSGGPNDYFKSCYKHALVHHALVHADGVNYQEMGNRILKNVYPKEYTTFDVDMFYPIYKRMVGRRMSFAIMQQFEIDFEIPEVTVGYHWYGGGKRCHRKILTITPDYKHSKNIIGRCMRAILGAA